MRIRISNNRSNSTIPRRPRVQTLTIAVFVIALLAGDTPLLFAAEHPIGDGAGLAASPVASRHRPTFAAQGVSGAPRSKGHPVLIASLVGMGAGAVLGAVSTSCSSPSSIAFPHPCGSRIWLEGALLGGAVGAGVGALIGLALKR
jgi:hypothetical protein